MAKRLASIVTIADGWSLVIADAVTELPFPPASFGIVPDAWDGGRDVGVVPQLDVHFRAVDAVQLTDVALYSGRRFVVEIDQVDLDDSDFDPTTDLIAKVAHGYLTGDGPLVLEVDDGDLAPGGTVDGEGYYVVTDDPDAFQIATSVANALNGVVVDLDYATRAELDLSGLAAGNIDLVLEAILPGIAGESITFDIVFDAAAGPTLSEVGNAVTLHAKNNVTTNAMLAAVINTSTKLRVKTDTVTPAYVLQSATDNFGATALAVVTGTQGFSLVPTDPLRFHWSHIVDVGTIDLDAQLARTVTIDHRPGTVAYTAKATFGDTIEVSIQADPVVERDG